HAPKDIYGPGGNAVLVAEGNISVANLQRDGHQNRVIRNLHVISTNVEEERRSGQDLGCRHKRLQILELDDRRGHQLGVLIEPVKLLALVLLRHGAGAKLFETTTGETVRLSCLPLLLVKRQSGSGDMFQRILLGTIKGHVV